MYSCVYSRTKRSNRLKRFEAIEIITRCLKGNELIISANGMISRELFSIQDSERNFYMLGSMGLASSIGFGLAFSIPSRNILILDGDGNILMNLGSLTTIGHFSPKNLLHIVLDNEIYASTGGQPTVSKTVKLEEVALAAGFQKVHKVYEAGELRKAVDQFADTEGPFFILVKIEGGEKEVPRVSIDPAKIKERFMKVIRE